MSTTATPPFPCELHGYYINDLIVGMTAVFGKTISEADLTLFAGLSGDTNPLHLNADYAATGRGGGRIAHGLLTASLSSAVIATKLPGPGAIYLNQSLRFTAPVRIGDTVTARVTITAVDKQKKRARMTTVCSTCEAVVIDGEAEVWVPARP